jgi:hypothetical protein
LLALIVISLFVLVLARSKNGSKKYVVEMPKDEFKADVPAQAAEPAAPAASAASAKKESKPKSKHKAKKKAKK